MYKLACILTSYGTTIISSFLFVGGVVVTRRVNTKMDVDQALDLEYLEKETDTDSNSKVKKKFIVEKSS